MRSWVLLASLAIVANAPMANAADPTSDSGQPVVSVITNPDWVRLPTADEMSYFYPPLASTLGVTGKVRMMCSVTAAGAVVACKIISEDPPGIGFGVAALQTAPYFQMKPRTVNGVPVGGALVTIPLNFALDGDQPATPDGLAAPAPSARALELARRAAAIAAGSDALEPALENFKQGLLRGVTQMAANGQVDADRATKLIDAYTQAYEAAEPALRTQMAAMYAKTYSERDLAAIADFLETPAGRAWAKGTQILNQQSTEGLRVWQRSVATDAQRRFCATTSCAGSVPMSAPKPTSK